MTDPTNQGQLLRVSFGESLQDYCTRQGFPLPREPVFGSAVLAPLRRLLRRLGLPVWAEITVGSSYHAYRALDAYIRIFGAGIQSPTQEAHFLLNTDRIPDDRWRSRHEEWFRCRSWVSVGQKPVTAAWNVEILTGIAPARQMCPLL